MYQCVFVQHTIQTVCWTWTWTFQTFHISNIGIVYTSVHLLVSGISAEAVDIAECSGMSVLLKFCVRFAQPTTIVQPLLWSFVHRMYFFFVRGCLSHMSEATSVADYCLSELEVEIASYSVVCMCDLWMIMPGSVVATVLHCPPHTIITDQFSVSP